MFYIEVRVINSASDAPSDRTPAGVGVSFVNIRHSQQSHAISGQVDFTLEFEDNIPYLLNGCEYFLEL